jgi:hypothetical protein
MVHPGFALSGVASANRDWRMGGVGDSGDSRMENVAGDSGDSREREKREGSEKEEGRSKMRNAKCNAVSQRSQ